MKQTTPEYTHSPLTDKAQAFSLRLFGQKQDGRLLVHNYSFAVSVAHLVAEIAEEEGASPEAAECALLSAWLLPAGYLYDYQNPTRYSQEAARQFFAQEMVADGLSQQVLHCIGIVLNGETPDTAEAGILNDAVQAVTYLSGQDDRAALLQLEQELALGQRYARPEWG
ncbi:MAG: hypothetical protein KDC66_10080, partial [Phaeodactylibacter sp.]|nr:hypothetical protein [Phaeodactylibacter sp.]